MANDGPGTRFWRTLDELEAAPEFRAAVDAEFPATNEFWTDEPSRRAFLRRMGASLALAGVAGCMRQPEEKIVPRVETPEHSAPGVPQTFATSMPIPGGAVGLLVRSRDGRPLKIEGNPQHPASLGGTDAVAQASILDLYDPDRSPVVRRNGQISNWPAFAAALKSRLDLHRPRKGAGLHLLTGSITSPTLLKQIGDLLTALTDARWYEFEPFSADNVRAGAKLAFGKELSPRYHVHKADVILSLDADFLTDGPAHLRLAREFARRRRIPASGRGTMNRLYVAECTPTLTGAAADHRLPLKPAQLAPLLADIAKRLGVEKSKVEGRKVEGWKSKTSQGFSEIPGMWSWISALVGDLKSAGRRALVIAGPSLPPEVHALAFVVNDRLQSVGETVEFIKPIDRNREQSPESLAELIKRLRAGAVESLVILDANPVYTAAGPMTFGSLLKNVPFTAHLGPFHDETARRCQWHVPQAHFLESWSDARGEDGTAGIVQPLIAPLYNGKSPHDLLNALHGKPDRSAYDTVRAFWRDRLGADRFEHRWNKSLHDGVIEGTASKPVAVTLKHIPGIFGNPWDVAAAGESNGMTLVFRPDPSIGDGRHANNGWLQELPKPFTKLTWGNAAIISPATGKQRNLKNGDVVQLATGGRQIAIPVLLVPGQPDGVVTLHAGHGRTHAGRNGNKVGVDVTPLQSASSPWFGSASLKPTGEHVELATTQNHFLMENRDLIRAGTLKEFQAAPDHPPFMQARGHHADGPPPSLYPERNQESPQWGMAINLTACIGCNACVIACQSENNIPIVGPDEVRRGREMHWIRVDTYYSGEPGASATGAPRVHHQPVPCMHCEHAPCEPVCPVAATTHSDDGLNEMTYNRCIGTRYCSNNCPYKVRRFNFLDYHTDVKETPVLQLLQNPEVSVRSRGVMEKCTYCVQRISAARIQAKIEGRAIRDGDVVTACQAACPSEAITFGDIADKTTAVAKQKSHPLNYGLLTELGTRPRTTYHAEVRNPHPRLVEEGKT